MTHTLQNNFIYIKMEVPSTEIYEVSGMEIKVFLTVHLFIYIIAHTFLTLGTG